MIRLLFNLLVLTTAIAVCLPPVSAEENTKKKQTGAANEKSILVVVISGFRSDATAAQIARTAARGTGNSGAYQLMVDLEESGCATKFFNWNGTSAGQFANQKAPGPEAIAGFIREASVKQGFDQLILVGHSWGGHTMLDVAKLLESNPTIKIDQAVGLDASSFSREERMKTLPDNIRELVNYYSNNAFCWGPWDQEDRIKNISLADAKNGFVVNGKPNYASRLSWEGHNAVEWDTKIHADVQKRILALQSKSSKIDQGVNTESSRPPTPF